MSQQNTNKPPHPRSPIINRNHIQDSTYVAHPAEGQSPIPTIPISKDPLRDLKPFLHHPLVEYSLLNSGEKTPTMSQFRFLKTFFLILF